MEYKVKVDLPNMPRKSQVTPDGEAGPDESDSMVEVAHLGLFQNGTTTTLKAPKEDEGFAPPDVRVATWEVVTGQTWPSDGTLVIDNSEADTQRKDALGEVAETPEAEEVKEAETIRKSLDLSGAPSGSEG